MLAARAAPTRLALVRRMCMDLAASEKMSTAQRIKQEPIQRDVLELIDELNLAMTRRRRKLSKADAREERESEKVRMKQVRGVENILGKMGFRHATNSAEDQLPASLTEIAFAGRSNVGKSSLLNALVGKSCGRSGTIGMAAVANRPGVTRSLNFYGNANGAQLVDLPGYGFALASPEETAQWQEEMRAYLAQRGAPLRVILVIDARQSMKQSDLDFLLWLDREARVPMHVVMSKCDLIQRTELCKRYTLLGKSLKGLSLRNFVAPHHMISSKTNAGIELLRSHLVELMPPEVLQRAQKHVGKADAEAQQQAAQQAQRELEEHLDEIVSPAARAFAAEKLKQATEKRAAQRARAKASAKTLVESKERTREAAFSFWARRSKRRG